MKNELIYKPEININVTQENKISNFGYKSFEERVFDLASLFNSNLCEKFTNTIKANTYLNVLGNNGINSLFRKTDIIFNGVYKLGLISDYMGFIPEENQIEIKTKFNSLTDNPFLHQKFHLLILAPLNNFAIENNIKAIDPIAFAYFEEGEHCYKKNYLITLSQWL